MNEYALGLKIREHILNAYDRNIPYDIRMLQILAIDLCTPDNQELLPAIQYLFNNKIFQETFYQTPQISDPLLEEPFLAEVQKIFSDTICKRIKQVIQGLLGLSESKAEQYLNVTTTNATQEIYKHPAQGNAMVAILGLIAGILMVSLAAMLYWFNIRQTRPIAETPIVEQSQLQVPQITNLTAEAANQSQGVDQVDQAVSSIQNLYSDLSRKDFNNATRYYSASCANQFEPEFFTQFHQVTVSDLHKTSLAGSIVNLQGNVTFVYHDGSTQTESRSYSVDTSLTPARISVSEFIQVLKARG